MFKDMKKICFLSGNSMLHKTFPITISYTETKRNFTYRHDLKNEAFFKIQKKGKYIKLAITEVKC